MTNRAHVERTLDEKMAVLLEQTANIAAHDARDAVRRRALLVVGLVATAVLGGLISIQAQLISADRDDRRVSENRCVERERQGRAIRDLLAATARASEQDPTVNPERRRAFAQSYAAFLDDYGPPVDCTVYRKK